ncbi:MAG: hypothetical protein ABT940_02075 [Alphaproteobacteria bacterium]
MSPRKYTAGEFLTEVVRPALATLGLKGGAAAEQLLLGTAMQESLLQYVEQMGGGPARGYFQMEPDTHKDIWVNFLAYKPDIAKTVRGIAGVASGTPSSDLLKTNPQYAAAMTRVHYYRVKGSIPAAGNTAAMAAYWKEHYNTAGGAGSVDEFITKWDTFGARGLFDPPMA